MSEPENISPQEKLDAWFVSLQLDKSAPLTKKERFFRWCDRYKYVFYFLGVILVPVILYGVFWIIERKTNAFLLYGFTKNEWFLFSGSYVGGVATLFSIVLTILHTKKIQIRQEKIFSIEKENDIICRLLSKFDIPNFCLLINFLGKIFFEVKYGRI